MTILLYPLTSCTDTQAPITSSQVLFISVPDLGFTLSMTLPHLHISDDEASALLPLATRTIDLLPSTMNSNSAGSKVSIPADFKPLVDTHLSPALQLAITPRPETIPDKSKAGVRPKVKPIFDFSSVTNP